MRKIALEYSLRRGDKRHWGPITCTFRMFNFSLYYTGGELKQPHSKTAVGVIGSLGLDTFNGVCKILYSLLYKSH
jgi:hypothetical protein